VLVLRDGRVAEPLPGANTDLNPWAFSVHPEIFLLVLALGFGYWWLVTTYGPSRVGADGAVVTRGQAVLFGSGVFVLAIAGSWPIHDIAEKYLYSVHMVQHLLMSLVAPPLLLLGTPRWMVDVVLASRPAIYAVTRRLLRPVPVTIIYSFVVLLTHAPVLVNNAPTNGLMHFSLHVLVLVSSLMMWFVVIVDTPMFKRIGPGARCIFLFVQSIIPNVPTAFLTFAEKPIYDYYRDVPRPFAFSVIDDQQLAAAIMKTSSVFIIWGSILAIYFAWAASDERASRKSKVVVLADGTVRRGDPVTTGPGPV
jgi:putative membrane protein